MSFANINALLEKIAATCNAENVNLNELNYRRGTLAELNTVIMTNPNILYIYYKLGRDNTLRLYEHLIAHVPNLAPEKCGINLDAEYIFVYSD